MSMNGSGVFVVNSTGQPVVASTLISSTVFNAFTADVATALSTALYKDGQQTVTANIPMGGFKHTGLAAGANNGDSVRYEQLVATSIVNTPAGSIAATTVQTAINELDTEKAALAGSASQAFSASNFTTAQGLAFPATQNPSADPNTLDDYEEGTFTGTLTGCTTSPTYTFRYVKTGKMVTLTIDTVSGAATGTSNTTSKSITGMPATLFPSQYIYLIVAIKDNGGAAIPAICYIATSGVINFGANLDNAAWTASGTASIYPMCMTYPI